VGSGIVQNRELNTCLRDEQDFVGDAIALETERDRLA